MLGKRECRKTWKAKTRKTRAIGREQDCPNPSLQGGKSNTSATTSTGGLRDQWRRKPLRQNGQPERRGHPRTAADAQ
jgi:hypothetical protein